MVPTITQRVVAVRLTFWLWPFRSGSLASLGTGYWGWNRAPHAHARCSSHSHSHGGHAHSGAVDAAGGAASLKAPSAGGHLADTGGYTLQI